MIGNKFLKNFIRDAEKIRPTSDEKNLVRGNILAFMEENPYKIGDRAPFWNFMANPFKAYGANIAVLSVVLVSFVVTGAAAEKSLPGDLLYPVKIYINEPVSSTMAFSKTKKAELKVKYAERRMQEAEKLAVSGKLDEKTQEEIKKQLKSNADDAVKNISNLANGSEEFESASKLSMNLEASFKAHKKVLESLGKAKGEINSMVNSIATEINEKEKDISAKRKEKEKKAVLKNPEQINPDKRMKDAVERMDELKKNIEQNRNKMGEKAVKTAEENIIRMEKKLEEGINMAREKKYQEASDLFGESAMMAQESKILIEVKTNLGIDMEEKNEF